MSERKQVAAMVSPEAHKAVHERADALGQTPSKTAAQIIEDALRARGAVNQYSEAQATVEVEIKTASAAVKGAKRAWALNPNGETERALNDAKARLELLRERLEIARDGLAESQTMLDAAQAEANQVELTTLKTEADALWAQMDSTVNAAAAAVLATRAEFLQFETLREQLKVNAAARKALGASRLVDEEHRWLPEAWNRACAQAFSNANCGEFPMSSWDAQIVANSLYSRLAYNLR